MIRRSTLALALAAGLLVAGCGDSGETIIPVAGAAEIVGSYRTEPYRALDPAVIAPLEAQCRQAQGGAPMVPPAAALILADARGGGRLLLMFADPNGATSECYGTIDANGRVMLEGGGGGAVEPGANVPPLGPLELGGLSGMSSSGGPGGSWSAQTGTLGPEIGGIVIELGDGTRIVATTAGGRYAAWWPGEQQPARILVYDRSGNLVREQPY